MEEIIVKTRGRDSYVSYFFYLWGGGREILYDLTRRGGQFYPGNIKFDSLSLSSLQEALTNLIHINFMS